MRNPTSRLALFLPNWIGDLVMATPAIRAVRQAFPADRLLAVGKPYVAAVLDGAPWFDGFIPIDRRGEAIRQLRSENIAVAVLFPNSFRSAWIAWRGGCKRRIGYNRYLRGLLLSDRLQPLRDERGRIRIAPVIDAYAALLAPLGITEVGRRMELFTTTADEARVDALWERWHWQGCEVVCLNPGAAFGAAKFWPVEHFAEVGRRLIDERDCRILVLCGPAERDLARQIVAAIDRPAARSLADEQPALGLTKACVRRSNLLITTDSGPRHFATAFDRPVITLFGPTHIEWTETFHPLGIHLQHRLPCGPCQQRTCPEGHHRCMTELRPDEVLPPAHRLLDGDPGRMPLEVRHAS